MKRTNKKTRIFVISGPSGCGKTTLIDKLLKSDKIKDTFVKVVTATTRQPRKGEKDGKDYIFLSKSDFLKKKNRNWFIETKEFSGNLYGTPVKYISMARKEGKDVLFCIDVEGALKIKQLYPAQAVLIFIYPPSEEELTRRLKGRGSEPEDIVKKRLRIAKSEVKYSIHYTYGIINDAVFAAVQRLKTIILAERLKI